MIHRRTITSASLALTVLAFGTIGKSPVIDGLIAAGRLDVDDAKGQWESFVIATVADPLPGIQRRPVIAGSDRRGTACASPGLIAPPAAGPRAAPCRRTSRSTAR